jgi:aspartyl protease family protein
MRSVITFAVLALAAAIVVPRYIGQQKPVPAPPAMAAGSAARTASGGRTVIVPRDSRGHFGVDARVSGRAVNFMVDTGASKVVLTESEAARLGIYPSPRDFADEVRTANGTVRAAPVKLDRVEIGGLALYDVDAMVLPDQTLHENLLGLSFLSRLRRFEYANGRLVLEQ